MPTYRGDVNANQLMVSLLAGEDFVIPPMNFNDLQFQLPIDLDSELYKSVSRLKNEDLSSGAVDGNGTFDVLMRGFKVHLKEEYQANRISGAEYTKAYVSLVQAAMQNAVQFLIGRDNAYWQGVIAQAQAVAARVALETAKVQYAAVLMEALNGRATYALTKLKLSTEDVQFASGEFSLNNILPQQLRLMVEQTEAARAQTANTRTDGETIVGLLGKQKDLYSQQITSYQRDAELKAGKLFSDAWTIQKTIDEGLLPPPNFNNASVDGVLGIIKLNNNLV